MLTWVIFPNKVDVGLSLQPSSFLQILHQTHNQLLSSKDSKYSPLYRFVAEILKLFSSFSPCRGTDKICIIFQSCLAIFTRFWITENKPLLPAVLPAYQLGPSMPHWAIGCFRQGVEVALPRYIWKIKALRLRKLYNVAFILLTWNKGFLGLMSWLISLFVPWSCIQWSRRSFAWHWQP